MQRSMMKLIARIILILAAAGAVVGVAMALVGTQGADAGNLQRGAPTQAGDANALPGNVGGEQQRGGPGGFEHGDGRAPNLFGAGEMLKDLVIIALIVAIVAPLTRLLGWLRAAPKQPANSEPPAIVP